MLIPGRPVIIDESDDVSRLRRDGVSGTLEEFRDSSEELPERVRPVGRNRAIGLIPDQVANVTYRVEEGGVMRSRCSGPSRWCHSGDRRAASEGCVASPGVVVLEPWCKRCRPVGVGEEEPPKPSSSRSTPPRGNGSRPCHARSTADSDGQNSDAGTACPEPGGSAATGGGSGARPVFRSSGTATAATRYQARGHRQPPADQQRHVESPVR